MEHYSILSSLIWNFFKMKCGLPDTGRQPAKNINHFFLPHENLEYNLKNVFMWVMWKMI